MAESTNSAGVLYQALMRHFLHQDRMVYMTMPVIAVIQTPTIGGSWSVAVKGYPWLGASVAVLGAVLTSCYLVYITAARADRDVNKKIMDKLAEELTAQTSAQGLHVRLSSEERRLCGSVFRLIVSVVVLFIAVDLVVAGWLIGK